MPGKEREATLPPMVLGHLKRYVPSSHYLGLFPITMHITKCDFISLCQVKLFTANAPSIKRSFQRFLLIFPHTKPAPNTSPNFDEHEQNTALTYASVVFLECCQYLVDLSKYVGYIKRNTLLNNLE